MRATTPTLTLFIGWLVLASNSACDVTPASRRAPRSAQSNAPTGEPDADIPAEPPSEPSPTGQPRLRTVYVPAYSHLPRGEKPKDRALFSILLSVRNMDSRAVITLTHVDYFDTSGHRVRRYLDGPRTLAPLETAEFSVATADDVGGSGANFLVYWQGPSDAHPLLAETVMLAHMGAGHVAFTSRGVELERRPDPAMFDDAQPDKDASEASP